MGEKLPRILPKVATSTSLLGSFTCRKFTTWYRRLYFPSEGRRAVDFCRPKNPTAGFEPANLGTSTPPICLHGVDRDNFTFTFTFTVYTLSYNRRPVMQPTCNTLSVDKQSNQLRNSLFINTLWTQGRAVWRYIRTVKGPSLADIRPVRPIYVSYSRASCE